jgi:hypothetical protein
MREFTRVTDIVCVAGIVSRSVCKVTRMVTMIRVYPEKFDSFMLA